MSKHLITLLLTCFMVINNACSQAKVETILYNDSSLKIVTYQISKAEYDSSADNSKKYLVDKTEKKKNGEITLKLSNNNILLLKDTLTNDDDSEKIVYRYHGYFNMEKLYLLSVEYYESGEYVLVNSVNGTQYKMFGEPKISPSGKYIFNSSGVLFYDVIPSIIQVRAVEQGSVALLVDIDLKDQWAIQNYKWINDSVIYFIKKSPEQDIDEYGAIKITSN